MIIKTVARVILLKTTHILAPRECLYCCIVQTKIKDRVEKHFSMPEADINVCNIYVCGSVIIPRGTGGTEYKGGGCEHTTNEKHFSLIKVHTECIFFTGPPPKKLKYGNPRLG